MIEVELAKTSPVLPPKAGSNTYRVKVQLPYLNNADALFGQMNTKSFEFVVDDKKYNAVLNQDLTAPFKIIPGEDPLIELLIEVYGDSFDTIYGGKKYFLKFE